MNKDDFLKEVRESGICPQNFDEMYSVFEKVQIETWNTLAVFHDICERNSINYQVAYGSLLGLVRDGGPIPWDYDVDVFVPYSEKNKLINALKNELKEEYYYYSPESDRNCRHPFMRVSPRKYRSDVLHVDVFYYIGAPNDKLQRNEHVGKIKKLSENRFYKLVNIREEARSSLRLFLSLLYHKIKCAFLPLDKMYSIQDELCIKYPLKKSDFFVEASFYGDYCDMPKEFIENTLLIDSEYGKLRIPTGFDSLLRLMYGDYIKVPDLKVRINEVEKTYRRFISSHRNND